jgi:hypothetical protein
VTPPYRQNVASAHFALFVVATLNKMFAHPTLLARNLWFAANEESAWQYKRWNDAIDRGDEP